MTKAKATQKALLLSLLSMLLCFSMLVGSTFAWFTDTVSSGVNTIMAGNLDIALSYKNAATENGYEEVSESTKNLFVDFEGDSMTWEPGAVSVCYFKLENLGTLAIKYQLQALVNDVVTGDDGAALSKVLKMAVVNGEVNYTDRASAITAAEDANAENIKNYQAIGSMEAGEKDEKAKFFAMIIYFPEEIGNEHEGLVYNRKDVTLQTDINISLNATQLTKENDSFGNDYDEPAEYPVMPDTTLEGNYTPGEKLVLEDSRVVATIPSTATLTATDAEGTATTITSTTPVKFKVSSADVNSNITVEEGDTVSTYEITLMTEDGKKVSSSEPIPATFNIGPNLGKITLYHNDELIDSTYDRITGILTFSTKDYSPFTIVNKPYTYADLSGEAAAQMAGEFEFDLPDANLTTENSDITIGGADLAKSGVTEIVFNGGVIETPYDGITFKPTLPNQSVPHIYNETNGSIIYLKVPSTAKVVFKNLTIDGLYNFLPGSSIASLEFENCIFNGCWIGKTNGMKNIKFTGCTFTLGKMNTTDVKDTNPLWLAPIENQTITLDKCTINANRPIKFSGDQPGDNTNPSATLNVTNCTFNLTPTDYDTNANRLDRLTAIRFDDDVQAVNATGNTMNSGHAFYQTNNNGYEDKGNNTLAEDILVKVEY